MPLDTRCHGGLTCTCRHTLVSLPRRLECVPRRPQLGLRTCQDDATCMLIRVPAMQTCAHCPSPLCPTHSTLQLPGVLWQSARPLSLSKSFRTQGFFRAMAGLTVAHQQDRTPLD